MKTIYCYDRFGNIKRLASLVGLVAVTSMAAGLWDVKAHASAQGFEVAQLPTVVVTGHRLDASEIENLPRVVVEGRRSVEAGADEHVAMGQGLTSVR